MLCYECWKAGRSREAVGLCHNCSAGLCADHACVIADPVTATRPVFKTVVLPQKARQLLCARCLRALEQLGARDLEVETSAEFCTSAVA